MLFLNFHQVIIYIRITLRWLEGKMTRLRASIVCEPTLALCARAIKLDTFIRLGKGEELTGGRSGDSIVSDACEAVIGAIYLDGGFANAKEFVNKFILNDLDNKKLFLIARLYYRKLFRDLEKKLIMNSSVKKVLNITNNSL